MLVKNCEAGQEKDLRTIFLPSLRDVYIEYYLCMAFYLGNGNKVLLLLPVMIGYNTNQPKNNNDTKA